MTTSNELVPMILPTVMIPLTLVSVGFSVVATFIAGLFGVQLKLEGPRKLLEVLLNPKVLASAFVLNALIFGGAYGWRWWSNYPRLISTIESQSQARAEGSDIPYSDVPTVHVSFSSLKTQPDIPVELEQVWRTQTGKGFFRGALVTDGRAFIGNTDGILRELELTTGKEIRSFYIGTSSNSELTIWNHSIYAGEGVHDTHHARVYRFDLKTGHYQGSYQTLGHTEAQSVVGHFEGEDTLFVVGGLDSLHAIDPVSMELKWKVDVGHTDGAVLVDQGTVFIGSGREKHDDKKYKSYATALEFKTGKILWQRELAASSWMRPVRVEENICFVSGEVYFPTERGHITCFDQKSGDHTIAMNAPDPIVSTTKVIDHSILYATLHGSVCRFDLEQRKNIWCSNTESKGAKSMAGASYDPKRHLVIYPSADNGLFVFDPNDGKVLMHWKPSSEQGDWKRTLGDVTISDDLWIVTDDDGSVRALKPQFGQKTAQKK